MSKIIPTTSAPATAPSASQPQQAQQPTAGSALPGPFVVGSHHPTFTTGASMAYGGPSAGLPGYPAGLSMTYQPTTFMAGQYPPPNVFVPGMHVQQSESGMGYAGYPYPTGPCWNYPAIYSPGHLHGTGSHPWNSATALYPNAATGPGMAQPQPAAPMWPPASMGAPQYVQPGYICTNYVICRPRIPSPPRGPHEMDVGPDGRFAAGTAASSPRFVASAAPVLNIAPKMASSGAALGAGAGVSSVPGGPRTTSVMGPSAGGVNGRKRVRPDSPVAYGSNDADGFLVPRRLPVRRSAPTPGPSHVQTGGGPGPKTDTDDLRKQRIIQRILRVLDVPRAVDSSQRAGGPSADAAGTDEKESQRSGVLQQNGRFGGSVPTAGGGFARQYASSVGSAYPVFPPTVSVQGEPGLHGGSYDGSAGVGLPTMGWAVNNRGPAFPGLSAPP